MFTRRMVRLTRGDVTRAEKNSTRNVKWKFGRPFERTFELETDYTCLCSLHEIILCYPSYGGKVQFRHGYLLHVRIYVKNFNGLNITRKITRVKRQVGLLFFLYIEEFSLA